MDESFSGHFNIGDNVPETITTPTPWISPIRTKREIIRNTKSWGRNWLCYCGSGKKYKRCCLRRDNEQRFKEAIEQGEYQESQ